MIITKNNKTDKPRMGEIMSSLRDFIHLIHLSINMLPLRGLIR